MRVVAISPHSDDAELGLGGYISRLFREKHGAAQVDVYVLAKGNAAHTKAGMASSAQGSITRREEGLKAAALLGMQVTFLEVAYDGSFGQAPRGQLVQALENALYSGLPADEVYIPLPNFHTDHTVAYEACISALRARKTVPLPKKVLAYEYPGQVWGPAPPATGYVYRELSVLDLEAKIEALKLHSTQWVSDPEAPSVGANAIRALAELRGSEIGVTLAERFYALREVD